MPPHRSAPRPTSLTRPSTTSAATTCGPASSTPSPRAVVTCCPAGTPVQPKRGFVPIQHVLPGDEVLTHRDRFRLVTHAVEREVSEALIELSRSYLGDQPLKCTRG